MVVPKGCKNETKNKQKKQNRQTVQHHGMLSGNESYCLIEQGAKQQKQK